MIGTFFADQAIDLLAADFGIENIFPLQGIEGGEQRQPRTGMNTPIGVSIVSEPSMMSFTFSFSIACE